MRFRMDPRAKLYLLLLANLMLFFHVGTGAEAVATGLFLLLFFLSGHTRTGIRLSVACWPLICLWCRWQGRAFYSICYRWCRWASA